MVGNNPPFLKFSFFDFCLLLHPPTVMQMLPATAYVKMVDIWLIFGQLVPFAEVVLLTAMEYIREGDGSGEEELDSSTFIKVEDNEEGKEEATVTEREDVKNWSIKQMYWLKVTGEKP